MSTFSNLAGTMSDSFAIGKRGVKLLQGTETPTSALVAPIGSLYLKKSGATIRVYQLVADAQWEPLLIAGSIPFLVTRSDDNVPNAITLSTTGSLDFSPSTGVLKIANNPEFAGVGGLVPPGGSTLQRPSAPKEGQIRYNTTEQTTEVYQGGAWAFLRGDANPAPRSYSRTITAADLVDGKIIITHNLGQKFVAVALFDQDDYFVVADRFRPLSDTQVELNLSSFTLTGSWTVCLSR